MNQSNPIDVLNRLATIHGRSLPVYLSQARPWTSRGDEPARAALARMAEDQVTMSDRLCQLILDREGVVELGEYPMNFTGKHDLSLQFLLGLVTAGQRRMVSAIGQCVQQLADDPAARAVAQEALERAHDHLQLLEELAPEAPVAEKR